MKEKIKLITFDLDDTLWDNRPTIINAEVFTRKWIEDKVGVINWGDFNDFLSLRDDLIKKDKSIAWDISKLRKEIFKIKLSHIKPEAFKNEIVDKAFKIFLSKRHEVSFFDGVEESIKELSKRFTLGVLTNGNADIYKFDIGKYFKFSISSLEAKESKPNRAHFELALNKMDAISFDNMLHIGDHQVNDIYAAYALGIDCIWFNNNQKWQQTFKKPEEFSDWKNLNKIIREKYER